MTEAKFVYFIKPVGMDGPIKIGYSIVPESRLLNLSIWSPFPLEIVATCPGGAKLESRLHRTFADSWLHHEWFQISPKLARLIEGLAAGESIEALIDMRAELPPRIVTRRYTKAFSAMVSWRMRATHAMKRAEKSHLDRFLLPPIVEAELFKLGRAHDGDGEIPADFNSAPIEAYIADPSAHGESYTKKFGVRPWWVREALQLAGAAA